MATRADRVRPSVMSGWLHRHLRLVLVLAFLGALAMAVEVAGIRDHFGLDFVRAQFERHWLSATLIFILLFALGNLIQIPGWIFLAAAVLALGELRGAAVTYLAACVSCVVTFFVIRVLGGDALRALEGRLAQRLLAQLDARPVWSQFWLRTLFQTAPALNYALALSGLRLRDYVLAAVLGLPLPIALYSVFFDYLAMMFGLS